MCMNTINDAKKTTKRKTRERTRNRHREKKKEPSKAECWLFFVFLYERIYKVLDKIARTPLNSTDLTVAEVLVTCDVGAVHLYHYIYYIRMKI